MNIYRNLNKICIFFLAFIFIINTFIFSIFTNPIKIKEIDYQVNKEQKISSLDSIVGKNLSLKSFELKGDIFAIKDQLEISSIELRPDRLQNRPKFKIKLKKLQNVKYVEEGDVLYLQPLENGNFDFSNKKTSFLVQIKRIDQNNIQLNLKADLKSWNIDKNMDESFIVSLNDSFSNDNIDNFLEFKLLENAKWWGIDQFFKIQSSQDFKAKKQRLEIDKNIVYIEKNDVLIFKQDKWQISSLSENINNYPIAKIKFFDSKIMEIEAWDETGNNKFLFTLPFVKNQNFVASDNFITSARKRTKTHISCILNQQRVVLKEKDILLKKDNRWKLIKKDIDFNEIKYDELFYFQKIEDKQSQKYLIGYIFDSMRTSFQKIEVPVFTFSNLQRFKTRK